jgi:hypothetical protein
MIYNEAKRKKKKTLPRVVDKSSAQEWEAVLCGAHAQLKQYAPQPEVKEHWDKLHSQWVDYSIELVESSSLKNDNKIKWNGKLHAEVNDHWSAIYKKYSARVPNSTSKCDISNESNTKKYSLKKYTKSTQLSSPQKAEAATLLHFAVDSTLGANKIDVQEKLESIIDAMTDPKYYYGSIQGMIKALLPWYNSLPQELTPLNQVRGISDANFKELYPLIKKESKKQTKHIVNRVLGIFQQKEKQRNATQTLNNLFNDRRIKKAFIKELLSGEHKFADKNASANYLLKLSIKDKTLIEESIDNAVNRLLDGISFELSFRPSSKLVTLLRVYLGRTKGKTLFESLSNIANNEIDILIEEHSEQITQELLNEGTLDLFSNAIDNVVNNPLINKLTEHFSKLLLKLRLLLKKFLNELINAGEDFVEKLCNIFGLSFDYSKSNFELPNELIGYLDS